MDPAAYVLTAFQGDDDILATELADKAGAAVETWLKDGIETAMNRHSGSMARDPIQPAAPTDKTER